MAENGQGIETKEPLKKKKVTAITITLIIAIAASIIGYITYKNNELIESYKNKVYPGVYVFDTDVSGMTESQLNETLKSMINEVSKKSINVTIGEQVFEKLYLNLGVSIDYDAFQKEILAYGKDKDREDKLIMINEPEDKVYEYKLKYEQKHVDEFINSIAESVKIAPLDAKVSINGGSVDITDGQAGKQLNIEELNTNIIATITNVESENITNIAGNLTDVTAKVTKDSLQQINHKISSFTTQFRYGPSGENLVTASEYVDDTLIMPGEVFSFSEAMGPTTIERGFVSSNAYANGEVIQSIGGGICQLSSTVYGAQLRAGILPKQRMNHMMTVSYVPLGLDATIADGFIDLQFENKYPYPIVINAYATGLSMTVEFWSNEATLNGVRYEPKSYPNGAYYADTYLYGYNSNNELVYEKYVDNSTYQPF